MLPVLVNRVYNLFISRTFCLAECRKMVCCLLVNVGQYHASYPNLLSMFSRSSRLLNFSIEILVTTKTTIACQWFGFGQQLAGRWSRPVRRWDAWNKRNDYSVHKAIFQRLYDHYKHCREYKYDVPFTCKTKASGKIVWSLQVSSLCKRCYLFYFLVWLRHMVHITTVIQRTLGYKNA